VQRQTYGYLSSCTVSLPFDCCQLRCFVTEVHVCSGIYGERKRETLDDAPLPECKKMFEKMAHFEPKINKKIWGAAQSPLPVGGEHSLPVGGGHPLPTLHPKAPQTSRLQHDPLHKILNKPLHVCEQLAYGCYC